MDELDRILNDFTSPTTGSLHGVAFIAVDKNGMSPELHITYFQVMTDYSGNIIYQKAAGRDSADPGAAKALELESSYWVASMTKLATALAVVQLVERDVISLDDDIRDKVTELKDLQVLRGMKDGEEPDLDAVQGKITLRFVQRAPKLFI